MCRVLETGAFHAGRERAAAASEPPSVLAAFRLFVPKCRDGREQSHSVLFSVIALGAAGLGKEVTSLLFRGFTSRVGKRQSAPPALPESGHFHARHLLNRHPQKLRLPKYTHS
jgi:hypothetical protein